MFDFNESDASVPQPHWAFADEPPAEWRDLVRPGHDGAVAEEEVENPVKNAVVGDDDIELELEGDGDDEGPSTMRGGSVGDMRSFKPKQEREKKCCVLM